MAIFESLNIFIQYFQYLLILIKSNIQLPFDWAQKIKGYVLVVLNFDFSSLDLPKELSFVRTFKFDYRIQFIVVCCLIPLVTTLALVTVFGDNATVLLFTGTSLGTFLVIMAMYLISGTWSTYLFIGAAVCYVAAAIGLLFSGMGRTLYYLYLRVMGKRGKNSQLQEELEKRADGEEVKDTTFGGKYGFLFKILRYFVSAVIYIIIAVIFSSFLRMNFFTGTPLRFEERIFSDSRRYVGIIISVICILQAILNIVAFIVSLIPKIGAIKTKVSYFIQKITLQVIFFVLTVSYTPIISTILDSFFCDNFECPIGTVFRDRYESNYNPDGLNVAYTSTNVSYNPNYCMPCDMQYNTTCGNFCAFTETRSLMKKDPTIQCGNLRTFYMYGGIALLIIYALGVPFLMVLLITIASHYLTKVDVRCLVEESEPKSKILKIWNKVTTALYMPIRYLILGGIFLLQLPLKLIQKHVKMPIVQAITKLGIEYLEESKDQEIGQIWAYRAQFSNNLLRDTYAHFEYRMRYFLCWEILIKLVVTSSSIVIPNVSSDKFALAVMAVIQIGAALVLLITSPYLVFLEDLVATALQIVTAVNFTYGAVTAYFTVPNWLRFILIFNVIAPVLAIIHTILFFCIKKFTKMSLSSKRIGKVDDNEIELDDVTDPNLSQNRLVANVDDPESSVGTTSTPGTPGSEIPTLQETGGKKSDKNQKKKREQALRKSLREANKREWKRIKEETREADQKITRLGYFIVNWFFFFSGFVTIVVLGFAIAGLGAGSVNEKFGNPILSDSVKYDSCSSARLARYGTTTASTFTTVTQKCCCQPDPYYKDTVFYPDSSNHNVELWTCSIDSTSGMSHKFVRVREIKDGTGKIIHSGLQFRDFCSKTFKYSYRETCATINGENVLYVTNSSSTTPTFAQKYLF